jgi:glycosyltransferase involved in cell wall biosynthesis
MGEPVRPSPFVSVIVPVYNDAARLATCLRALGAQTYPASRYEVIVVDNGSDVPVAPVVASALPRARVVTETRPGSYAARNRGLAEARGDLFAFTDSDCLPAADWLAEGTTALLSTPNCGLVGGRIAVVFAQPAAPTPVETFSGMTARQQEHFLTVDHFAETANLFTRRTVVDEVGSFAPWLKSRGDVVFGQRVFAAGYRLVYAERAVVTHPAVRSLRQLCRRTARMIGGKHDVRRTMSGSVATTRTSSTDVWSLPRLAVRIWRQPDTGRGHRWRVLGILMFVHTVALGERLRLRLGGISRR